MKKFFINILFNNHLANRNASKKFVCLLTFCIVSLISNNVFAQEDNNNSLLNKERMILEQLNILKRNNIDTVDDKRNDIIEPTNTLEATPTNTLIPTYTDTITPTPTKVIVNIKKNERKETDITNDNKPSNTFPQKDIEVILNGNASINDNTTKSDVSCSKERNQLEIANQKILELYTELENKKKQLILVETEVERLSEVIEKRNRAELGNGASPSPNIVNKNAVHQRQQIQMRKPINDLEAEKADMPIAVVIVNKANLRAGPSLKDSPLLEVSKGTRLVVETRQGAWYRVMAPNGKRAWVSSDVVNFGPNANSKPSFTTRIKGYNQDVEDRTESIFK